MRSLPRIPGWLLSALLLCAPLAPALPAQEDRPDVFEVELKRIRSKMEQGQWARAEGQLQAILRSHAGQPYVREHLGEIELILKRCQFWPNHEEVDVGALLKGELLHLDRKRGSLKLRYQTPGQMDYASGAGSGIQPFAISFSGPYSIELKGEETASLAVCLESDSAITVEFGVTPSEKPTGYQPDPSRVIERWVEITTISVDRRGERRERTERKEFTTRGEGATPDLKIEVDAYRVTTRFDGKEILAVRKDRTLFGGFGFRSGQPHSDDVLVEGEAPVWIQAQRDKQAIGPMREFDRAWKLEDHVPAWLLEPVQAPATSAPIARRTGSRSSHGAATRRPLSEEEIEAIQTAAARELYSGNPKRCLERIAEGIRRGAPARAMQTLSSTANKALHGPSWTAKHTFESANYRVASDVSRSVSRKVAQVLEESLQHVSLRLGHTPDTRSRKFIVYVFSGERSYNRFVQDVFGARMENTLGMYSGALKQLLILHAESEDDYLSTTRHEGFHQYLDAFPMEKPIWLNEGLAEYFAAARNKGSAWHDGALELGRLEVLRQLMQREGGLKAHLFPLERFVALQPMEFMANAQVAYAQAWAFVHFLRHSSVRNRDAFQRLMSELMAGRPASQAIARAFQGTDWHRLDLEFRRHVADL